MESQRHLFDIPEDLAYFNCAYYAPLLLESERRLHAGVSAKKHPWERTASEFFDDAETMRQLCADLLGGEADGYALVPAASYGIGTAARIMEEVVGKGDQILVIEEEFPGIILPMRRLAAETGATIVTVALPDDGDWTGALRRRMDHTTRIVAVSSCHWTNGSLVDLVEMRRCCDEVNAVLIVDATQSLGAMELPMDAIRPDFLVASGYKWLLCPYGFCLLYVDEKWWMHRPLEESWLARENSEDFVRLGYNDNYKKGARRFDVGEKCTPTILPGAIAALEQIKKWGIRNIQEHLSVINETIISRLQPLGFQVADKNRRSPQFFGARPPAGYSADLIHQLRERKIYISQRGNALRISPHLHITDGDINHLTGSLKELLKR